MKWRFVIWIHRSFLNAVNLDIPLISSQMFYINVIEWKYLLQRKNIFTHWTQKNPLKASHIFYC